MQTGQLLSSVFSRISQASPKQIELTPGQVFKGTVTRLYPDNMAQVQIGGVQVQAKLEANLEVGQKAWLQVQPTSNPVTLKVLTSPDNPQELQDTSIGGLMRSLGVADAPDSRSVVEALVKQNMPVNKDTVNAFLEVVKSQGNSKEVVDAFLLAMKRNLPLTPDVVGSLKTFLSGKPLADTIQQFMGEVEAFLQSTPDESSSAAQNHLSDKPAPTVSPNLRQLLTRAAAKIADLPISLTSAGQQPLPSEESIVPSQTTSLTQSAGKAGNQQPIANQAASMSIQESGMDSSNQLVKPVIAPGMQGNTNPESQVQGDSRQTNPVFPKPAQNTSLPETQGQPVQNQNTTANQMNNKPQVPSSGQGVQNSAPPVNDPQIQATGIGKEAEGIQARNLPGNIQNSADDNIPVTKADSTLAQPAMQTGNLGQKSATSSDNQQVPKQGQVLANPTEVQSGSQAYAEPTQPQATQAKEAAASQFISRNGSIPTGETQVNQLGTTISSQQAASANAVSAQSQADQETATVIASADKPILLKDLFQKLGLSHERQMMTQRFGGGEQTAAQTNLDSVKSLLMQVTQSSAQLPDSLKQAADTLLQQVTGQQLLLTQPSNQAITQIVMQVPLRTDNGDQTAFVQIESKKQDGGQLDAQNCRLFFNLDLHVLGITMVDVNIVNKIVNINIYNNLPWMEGVVSQAKETFSAQLRDTGYQLSHLKTQPIPQNKTNAASSVSTNQLGSTYKGVDLRI